MGCFDLLVQIDKQNGSWNLRLVNLCSMTGDDRRHIEGVLFEDQLFNCAVLDSLGIGILVDSETQNEHVLNKMDDRSLRR